MSWKLAQVCEPVRKMARPLPSVKYRGLAGLACNGPVAGQRDETHPGTSFCSGAEGRRDPAVACLLLFERVIPGLDYSPLQREVYVRSGVGKHLSDSHKCLLKTYDVQEVPNMTVCRCPSSHPSFPEVARRPSGSQARTECRVSG